jgi:hypothetical protein
MINQVPDYREKTAPQSDRLDQIAVDLSREVERFIERSPIKDWYVLKLHGALADYRREKGL